MPAAQDTDEGAFGLDVSQFGSSESGIGRLCLGNRIGRSNLVLDMSHPGAKVSGWSNVCGRIAWRVRNKHSGTK